MSRRKCVVHGENYVSTETQRRRITTDAVHTTGAVVTTVGRSSAPPLQLRRLVSSPVVVGCKRMLGGPSLQSQHLAAGEEANRLPETPEFRVLALGGLNPGEIAPALRG